MKIILHRSTTGRWSYDIVVDDINQPLSIIDMAQIEKIRIMLDVYMDKMVEHSKKMGLIRKKEAKARKQSEAGKLSSINKNNSIRLKGDKIGKPKIKK